MAADRQAAERTDRKAGKDRSKYRWPGYIQFLFIAGLTLTFAWVAVSMARHRFCRGSLSHQMYDSQR
jgi:hypothetical protein